MVTVPLAMPAARSPRWLVGGSLPGCLGRRASDWRPWKSRLAGGAVEGVFRELAGARAHRGGRGMWAGGGTGSLGALKGVSTAITPEDFSAAVRSMEATVPEGMVDWTI